MRAESPKPAERSGPAQAGRAAERDQQLSALLDRLDAEDAADAERSNRRAARSRYRRASVGMQVHHPGGSSTNRKVTTRDLSAGGMSFVHNGYMHTGTRVDVNLPRFVGGEDVVAGRVVYCGHIAGTWHTVGVKFNCKVFPKLYLDPDQAGGSSIDATQPQAIRGRVLLLEEVELDRRLFAHHLRKTQLELTQAESLDEAESKIKEKADSPERFELVVAEVRLGDGGMPPAEIVSRLIATGCRVAVCSAETDPEVLRAVQKAGAVGILRKPYEPDKLLGNLVDWLGIHSGGDAIVSTLADQPDMRPLLTEFVGKAKALGQVLTDAARADDFDRVRSVCMVLRGSGTGYGFAAVTEAATEVLEMVDKTKSLSDASAVIERLRAICGRVSDAAPEDDEGHPAIAA